MLDTTQDDITIKYTTNNNKEAGTYFFEANEVVISCMFMNIIFYALVKYMGPFIYKLFQNKELLTLLIKNKKTIIYVNVSDSFKENCEEHHSHQKLSSCLLDCLKYYYYIYIDPSHAECSQIFV